MNLTEEVIALFRKAKETDEYFNPWILQGICDALAEGDPKISENGMPDDVIDWIYEMWSR